MSEPTKDDFMRDLLELERLLWWRTELEYGPMPRITGLLESPERDLTQRCPICHAPPGEPCLSPHQPSAQPWP
jgi:hypothetical protein